MDTNSTYNPNRGWIIGLEAANYRPQYLWSVSPHRIIATHDFVKARRFYNLEDAFAVVDNAALEPGTYRVVNIETGIEATR